MTYFVLFSLVWKIRSFLISMKRKDVYSHQVLRDARVQDGGQGEVDPVQVVWVSWRRSAEGKQG